MMLGIFSCAFYPSVCFLWRNVYLGVLPIFWLGYYYYYYFNIKLLKLFVDFEYYFHVITSFTNAFFHFVGCSLTMVSFPVKKFLNLIWSYLLMLVFISFSLRYSSKKMLLWFIMFSLPFRYLIIFELIFVYGVEVCSNFSFFVPVPYWFEDCSFLAYLEIWVQDA